MVSIGQKAPDFSLDAVVGHDFKTVNLSDYRGKWVLLFFYPLDFTVVCPTEIKEHSSRYGEFEKRNCVVLGCSTDSRYAHREWIQKDLGELKYPLLADFQKETARDYNALLAAGFACRASFLIDPEGNVQYAAYHNADIGRSVTEELRVLDALQTGELCPVEWRKGQKTLGR